MRVLLMAVSAVLLCACNNDQAANVVTENGAVVSESLRGNDVTAIDAASNDAANMAADVEILEAETNIVADANESGEPETNETR